jgi:hypothetical protein
VSTVCAAVLCDSEQCRQKPLARLGGRYGSRSQDWLVWTFTTESRLFNGDSVFWHFLKGFGNSGPSLGEAEANLYLPNSRYIASITGWARPMRFSTFELMVGPGLPTRPSSNGPTRRQMVVIPQKEGNPFAYGLGILTSGFAPTHTPHKESHALCGP